MEALRLELEPGVGGSYQARPCSSMSWHVLDRLDLKERDVFMNTRPHQRSARNDPIARLGGSGAMNKAVHRMTHAHV